MTRRRRHAVLAAGGLAVLTACSGGSNGVVRAPTSTGSIIAPSATSTSASPVSPTSSRSTGAARPVVRVVPSTGLRDRQRVQVRGSGFTPGESLQVVQCASRGAATGPGDCNLSGMTAVSSDSDGRVSASLTVVRGPFGSNGVVCSGRTQCLVSVTQASLQPSEEADAPITFAR